VVPVPAVPATWVSDVEAPSLNCNQHHPEELGLASIPSRPRHPVDRGDPFPSEISNTYAQSSSSLLWPNELHVPYFPQTPLTPSPVVDVNTDSPSGIAPLQYDDTTTPTRDISSTMPPSELPYFSTSTVANGSMWDNRSSLAMGSIHSALSRKTPVITDSAIHTTNCPSNNRSSIGLYSGYGYRSAARNFGSASKRRHHKAGVQPIAPSQVSVPRRISKKDWCEECEVGFTQRQGLQRHRKDVHGSRQLCPCCRDFQWSLGRKYALRKHFEATHPGVALPEILQQQDTGGSLRTLS
jgi:hypothetical protein